MPNFNSFFQFTSLQDLLTQRKGERLNFMYFMYNFYGKLTSMSQIQGLVTINQQEHNFTDTLFSDGDQQG